jgi:hypothetical protein
MRKIDLYMPKAGQWAYVCSTTKSKTCKEAVLKFKQVHGIAPEHKNVKALFAKG